MMTPNCVFPSPNISSELQIQTLKTFKSLQKMQKYPEEFYIRDERVTSGSV